MLSTEQVVCSATKPTVRQQNSLRALYAGSSDEDAVGSGLNPLGNYLMDRISSDYMEVGLKSGRVERIDIAFPTFRQQFP